MNKANRPAWARGQRLEESYMKWRIALIMVGMMMAVLLAACDGSAATQTPATSGAPAAAAQATPGTRAGDDPRQRPRCGERAGQRADGRTGAADRRSDCPGAGGRQQGERSGRHRV